MFCHSDHVTKNRLVLAPLIEKMQSRVLSQPRHTDRRAIIECSLLVDIEFKLKFINLIINQIIAAADSPDIINIYRFLLTQLIGKKLVISDVLRTGQKLTGES